MNEALCRALIQADLGEEDVAARLEVDTKTVRRWLEGRIPYRRHRWTLAAILQVSEVDLWPQLRVGRSRPEEVVAVYPHRDQVPDGIWRQVIRSAQHDVAVLARTGLFLASVPGVLDDLRMRVRGGVRARVCLQDPSFSAEHNDSRCAEPDGYKDKSINALSLFCALRADGDVQVRLHPADHYASLVFADQQLLAIQRVYGIPPGQRPVLYVRHTDDTGMFESYRDSFERAWSSAEPHTFRPRSR